ncbi:MAG: hypothetical protein P8Y45_00155 [Exilibacterium sp.]
MKELKIIFAGAKGSGKTTAITTLSETPVYSVTGHGEADPAVVRHPTSAAMDCGEILLEGGQRVKLYGTHLGRRLNKTRRGTLYRETLYNNQNNHNSRSSKCTATQGGVFTGNVLGIAVLINNAARTPLEELDWSLQQLSSTMYSPIYSTTAHTAIAIGITHTDQSNCPSMDLYHQFMREKKLFYPLFPVDTRRSKDVNVLLEAMMALLQVA